MLHTQKNETTLVTSVVKNFNTIFILSIWLSLAGGANLALYTSFAWRDITLVLSLFYLSYCSQVLTTRKKKFLYCSIIYKCCWTGKTWYCLHSIYLLKLFTVHLTKFACVVLLSTGFTRHARLNIIFILLVLVVCLQVLPNGQKLLVF